MPTFTKVNPGDPIQAHQLNQVIDALIGTTSAGVPIAVTSVNDATNYALTVQNDEAGNSRALNVLKSDGTTLIKADASGVTLGSPLILPTGSITSTAIADAGIQNVDLGPDVARANLLTNGGFEIWQRGNGPFSANGTSAADRWYLAIAGTDTLAVSRDAANTDASPYSAACTFTLGTGAGGTRLTQDFKTIDSQVVAGLRSLSVRVRTSVANAVRVGIYDGAAWQYSAYHSGSGAYQTLTITATVSNSASYYQTGVFFAASCTAYLDNACLVVGSQPANYVPLHPADDLARCLRYFEVIGGANGFVWTGQAYGTTPFLAMAWFQAIKAVVPTLTVNSPTSFTTTNAAASNIAVATLAANAQTAKVAALAGTVAAGLVAGNATLGFTSGPGSIYAEANP